MLSAAYAQPIEDQSVRHLQAAAKRLGVGDPSRAQVHLALSRLARMDEPQRSAQRLLLADRLMQSGLPPEAILKAMDQQGAGLGKYSPDQPRVLAGSGRASGEWTTGGEASPSSAPPPKPTGAAASRQVASDVGVGRPGLTLLNIAFPVGATTPGFDLGAMSDAALGALAAFIAGLGEASALTTAVAAGGGIAALGVLFIPSTGPRGKWIEVGGRGDISYYQNPDEATVRLKYTTPDGVLHVFAASPGPGGDYRGPDGRVFARLIKSGVNAGILISTAELVGTDTDEPQSCPAAVKDNGGKLGRAYEDYAKPLFNPGNPTPSGMAYAFWSPSDHKWVKIDDCFQATGKALAEYKGPNYEEHLLKNDGPWQGMWEGMKNQAKVQVVAKGDRSLTWFFAEKPVADFVREEFKTDFPQIQVEWLPWSGEPK